MKAREILVISTTILVLSGMAIGEMTITENFDSDPALRGWIDSSANNFYWYESGGSIIGSNVQRHPEEAFYLPLGATYTQDSNFSASWEAYKYGASASYTNQAMYIGFFNKDNWFLDGDPDTYNAKDVVAVSYWDGIAASWDHTNVYARVATSVGGLSEYRDSGMYDIGVNNILYQYSLTYTAGAGANSAGQLVLEIRTGGSLVSTLTVDLLVGDTFAVNSFGVFTGHSAYNDVSGWSGAWPLDNVQISGPAADPVTCQEAIEQGYGLISDINGDCIADFADFVSLALNWTKCNDPEIPTCSF